MIEGLARAGGSMAIECQRVSASVCELAGRIHDWIMECWDAFWRWWDGEPEIEIRRIQQVYPLVLVGGVHFPPQMPAGVPGPMPQFFRSLLRNHHPQLSMFPPRLPLALEYQSPPPREPVRRPPLEVSSLGYCVHLTHPSLLGRELGIIVVGRVPVSLLRHPGEPGFLQELELDTLYASNRLRALEWARSSSSQAPYPLQLETLEEMRERMARKSKRVRAQWLSQIAPKPLQLVEVKKEEKMEASRSQPAMDYPLVPIAKQLPSQQYYPSHVRQWVFMPAGLCYRFDSRVRASLQRGTPPPPLAKRMLALEYQGGVEPLPVVDPKQAFIQLHIQKFLYLSVLPREMQPVLARALQEKYPAPEGETWLGLCETGGFMAEAPLPLHHIYLIQSSLSHFLKRLKGILDVGNIASNLGKLQQALAQYKRLLADFEQNPQSTTLDQCIAGLPYEEALRPLSQSRAKKWYFRRNEFLFREGRFPVEIEVLKVWLKMSERAKLAQLSFETTCKRYQQSQGCMDDKMPSWLMTFLPFGSYARNWDGMEQKQKEIREFMQLAPALELCLRLPDAVVNPCLKQHKKIAERVYRFRKEQKENQSVDLPAIPTWLVPMILSGKPLNEVLKSPKLLQEAIAWSRRAQFLELVTYLPEELNCVGDELIRARRALKEAPLTEVLAHSLFGWKEPIEWICAGALSKGKEPKKISIEDVRSWERSPEIALGQARYLMRRVKQEGAPALEESFKTHGYIPLDPQESQLIEGGWSTLQSMADSWTSVGAIADAGLFIKKVSDYFEQSHGVFNYDLWAWMGAIQQSLEKRSFEERYQLYLAVHQILLTGLDKMDWLKTDDSKLATLEEAQAGTDSQVKELIQNVVKFLEPYRASEDVAQLWQSFRHRYQELEVFITKESIAWHDQIGHIADMHSLPLKEIIQYSSADDIQVRLRPLVQLIERLIAGYMQQCLHVSGEWQLAGMVQSFDSVRSLLEQDEWLSEAELLKRAQEVTAEVMKYLGLLLNQLPALREQEGRLLDEQVKRIEALQGDMKQVKGGIAEQNRIISANSSWNPLAKPSAQRLAAEAEKKTLEQELDRMRLQEKSYQLKMDIIKKHGLIEILTIAAKLLSVEKIQ